jgi:hypothetical protein
MSTKKLTLETKSGKNYFQIEENNGKYTLSKVIYTTSFFGSTKYEKLGHAKSLADAIVLAKTTVQGSIINQDLS